MTLAPTIAAHPDVAGATNPPLIAAVEAAYACAAVCEVCADACLAEDMVADLRRCIRLDLDCADICLATARLGVRRTSSNEALIRAQLQLCQEACRLCAEECERHAEKHEHCRICADTCRRCEDACREAIATL